MTHIPFCLCLLVLQGLWSSSSWEVSVPFLEPNWMYPGMDPSHPGHHLFQRLPSGKRFRAIRTKTSRHLNSFFPMAVGLTNKPPAPHWLCPTTHNSPPPAHNLQLIYYWHYHQSLHLCTAHAHNSVTVYTLFYFILFYFLYIVVFHIVVLCSVHQWHQGNFLYVQTYLANKRILILILIL